jgi:type III secretory pathway lipoprotein EscJ
MPALFLFTVPGARMSGEEDKQHVIKDHERRFTEIKEAQRDHEKRLKSLEEVFARQDEKQKQIFMTLGEIKQLLTSSMEDMKKDNEKTIADMKNIIAPLSEDVESLKSKPGKTWERIKYALISAIISGIVGVLIGLAFGGK